MECEEGAKIRTFTIDQLVSGIKLQSQKDLARAITIVENQQEHYLELVSKLYFLSGNSHIIGITGSPGTGKSSLVDKLASRLQRSGKKVAVLAIDPSSPFSNGAILGDRIRMATVQQSHDIFVRSLASRGNVGGLTKSVRHITTLLEAFGFDYILIETVGSGQTEIEIVNLSHTTLVVVAPGLGDEIQAQKAGIMEIADVFVVNKADLPNSAITVRHITQMIHSEAVLNRKQVPVLPTSAVTESGIDELINSIEKRWQSINQTGERSEIEMKHAKYKLAESLKEKILSYLDETILKSTEWSETVYKVKQKLTDPEKAAETIFKNHFNMNDLDQTWRGE
jgi:LAO/AO transport system kinase